MISLGRFILVHATCIVTAERYFHFIGATGLTGHVHDLYEAIRARFEQDGAFQEHASHLTDDLG